MDSRCSHRHDSTCDEHGTERCGDGGHCLARVRAECCHQRQSSFLYRKLVAPFRQTEGQPSSLSTPLPRSRILPEWVFVAIRRSNTSRASTHFFGCFSTRVIAPERTSSVSHTPPPHVRNLARGDSSISPRPASGCLRDLARFSRLATGTNALHDEQRFYCRWCMASSAVVRIKLHSFTLGTRRRRAQSRRRYRVFVSPRIVGRPHTSWRTDSTSSRRVFTGLRQARRQLLTTSRWSRGHRELTVRSLRMGVTGLAAPMVGTLC